MGTTISLSFGDFAREASKSARMQPLRLTLLYEEALRVPRQSRLLHVVAGTAWVSVAGKDHIVGRGESLSLPASRHCAVVSAAGGGALFFELS